MWYIVSLQLWPGLHRGETGDETEGAPRCLQGGDVEKSAIAEHAWQNHHPIHFHWEETTVLNHGREQELLVKEALHIQMTPSEECFNRDGGLESPWLLDHCDEEAGTEEQSLPTFDLQ